MPYRSKLTPSARQRLPTCDGHEHPLLTPRSSDFSKSNMGYRDAAHCVCHLCQGEKKVGIDVRVSLLNHLSTVARIKFKRPEAPEDQGHGSAPIQEATR